MIKEKLRSWGSELNKLIVLFRTTINSFKKRGVSTFILLYYEAIFDWKFNVKTTGFIKTKEEEDIKSSDRKYAADYLGTNLYLLKRIFSKLTIDFESSVFVDFGCGKGRVLFFASQYNFNRIIGVEFSNKLFKIAQNNITRYQDKFSVRLNNVYIEQTNAANYKIHRDANVFFFYNPFEEQVMTRVLENINNSCKENPRKITLIYVEPVCYRLFEEYGYKPLYKVFLNKKSINCDAIVYSN